MKKSIFRNGVRFSSTLFFTAALSSVGTNALAEPKALRLDVSEQALEEALLELSSQADVNILGLSRSLDGLASPAVEGEMTLEQALQRLLEGTNLEFDIAHTGTVIIRTPEKAAVREDEKADGRNRPTQTPHELLVTGIRNSLRVSADIKRKSSVVVDVITAEDVGKFPDPNLAEALQRMTGIQISRDRGGEGRWVSVRGLSSQYNMTTLNGHVLATDNAGRDFSFDVMPSEMIANAKVYKTSSASLPEGSIGGLVDLQTRRPLDDPGFRVHGSVGGFYDDATGRWTEQLAGAFQNTDQAERFGVSLAASYYKRDWRADTYDTFVSSMEPVGADGSGVRTGSAQGEAVFPGIISFQTKFGERERLGVTGTLEYRAGERLTSRLTGFYSHYKTPESAYSYNINFYSNDGAKRFDNAKLAPYGRDGEDVWLLSSFELDDIPLEVGNDTKAREAKTWMLGWDSRWHATNRLTFNLGLGYSEANRPINGTEYYTVAGAPGGHFKYNAEPKVPRVECRFEDGRRCLDINDDQLGLHFMEPKGENVNDQALSFRFDGAYEFPELRLLESLEMGLVHSQRQKKKVDWRPTDPCAFCGFEQTLGEVGVEARVDFPGRYRYPSGFERWPALDPMALFGAARRHRGDEYFASNILARPQPRASSEIHETVSGAYWQANLSLESWSANAGVRWVQTNSVSRGHSQELLSLQDIPGSTNWDASFSEVIPVQSTNTYDNLLPSLNVKYQLNDGLLFRFSASRSMTRPTLSQLGPDVMWEVNSPPPRLNRNGNPRLEPFSSDALDLSIEWYNEQGSSAALALFQKSIEGLIVDDEFTQALEVTRLDAEGRTTTETMDFDVSAPRNGAHARVHGLELAYQYLFENGFGFMANMTWVDSDSELSSEAEQESTELSGVSRYSYNLVGLYEQGPIGARLAWSFRDAFTACNTCGPGGMPTTAADFGSLDFSLSYQLNDQLSLYAEGQNLLEADNHTYSLNPRVTQSYEAYSRRFELGVRLAFP